MKKTFITTVCLLSILALTAQNQPAVHKKLAKNVIPSPVIRLVEKQGFDILSKSRNGLQSFFILLHLHGRADKDQSLHLRIHQYDAPLTFPDLAVTSQTIPLSKSLFSKTGMDTVVSIICTVIVQPQDSLSGIEKAFIVKEGDEDDPFTLVIHSAKPRGKKVNPDTAGTSSGHAGVTGSEKGAGTRSGADKAKATKAVPFDSNLSNSDADTVSTSSSSGPGKALTVTLVGSDTSFNPIISQDILTRIYTVKLHFHANGTPGNDTIKVPLEIAVLNAGGVSPVLKTDTITIQPADWTHKDAKDNIEKLAKFQISAVKTFEHDVSFFILQKGDASNPAEIRITAIGLYNPNKPFWVEVGANFDFADGLKANNVFGGVFLQKRDIRPIFSGRSNPDKPKRLGLFAGVFTSKTISDVSTDDYSVQKYYNDRSTRLSRNDSLGAFIDTGKIKITQVVKNIGLFFSPSVRLTNGSADAEGLHVSASLWAELQWQTISTSYDYSGMQRSDTFYVPPHMLDTAVTRLKQGSNLDIRSHYLGVGLPIYFKEDDANVFFNPVFGLSNQPSSQDMKSFTDITSRKWRPFYIFQFRLNEEHFGIAFTGEVRGLLMHNSKPLVSLALTKKFDLSKFLEFK